jgi:phosphoglycolate phosphatase-like HAD superfamily hydrolase
MFLKREEIQLLVTDFNGVLDDYYDKKFTFLNDILGDTLRHKLPELWVYIERAYIAQRSATVEQSVEAFFSMNNHVMTDRQTEHLKSGMKHSGITEAATNFLDSLDIDFIIYTSLSDKQISMALGDTTYAVSSRTGAAEGKPSVIDLQTIISQYTVKPERVCVIGDGLTDDLMPATLLGTQTLLVSPFAQKTIFV